LIVVVRVGNWCATALEIEGVSGIQHVSVSCGYIQSHLLFKLLL